MKQLRKSRAENSISLSKLNLCVPLSSHSSLFVFVNAMLNAFGDLKSLRSLYEET